MPINAASIGLMPINAASIGLMHINAASIGLMHINAARIGLFFIPLRTQVYKMATELRAYFESIVLDFLKSCGTEKDDTPIHGTRRALGRLAHHLSSEDAPHVGAGKAAAVEVRPRRSQRRRRNEIPKHDSDTESETGRSSVEVSTPLTPASETSSTFTVNSVSGTKRESSRLRQNSLSQSHGMTLRERPAKRVLEESDSEEEGEEEEEGGGRGRTRSWGTPHKRQRLSSESEGGSEGGSEGEEERLPLFTRTSRGRVVKPAHKFSMFNNV